MLNKSLIFIFIASGLLINAVSSASDYQWGMRTRYQSVNDTWLNNAQALTTRIKLTAHYQLDKAQQWQLIFFKYCKSTSKAFTTRKLDIIFTARKLDI